MVQLLNPKRKVTDPRKKSTNVVVLNEKLILKIHFPSWNTMRDLFVIEIIYEKRFTTLHN